MLSRFSRVRCCDLVDCSPPGSSVNGILQRSLPEWAATPSSKDPPNPRIEPKSRVSSALAGRFFARRANLEGTWSLCVSHSDVFDSLRPHGLKPSRLLSPWDSPGKTAGVGNHSLLPDPGSNLGVLHCRQIFPAEALGKPLNHQGIPIIKKTKPFKT